MEWVELELTEQSSHLRIRVSSDAVKHDGVRLTVTARQHQVIADRHGAFLPTPKLCDLIHARADLRVKTSVFQDRNSHDEADVLSRAIDTDLNSDLMQKAADGAKNLIDGRKIALVSNVGLNWVLSNQMVYDGAKCKVSRHGLYADHEGSISAVMPWRYGCWHAAGTGEPENDTASSVLHFARLVHGEVHVGTPYKVGRVAWEKQRLDWALMHTSLAPMLHQGPMLRWTRVPTVPPALPR